MSPTINWPGRWTGQPQPDAVILWVSDMPELNEQTKLKIESKSDKVYRVNQLITIECALSTRAAGWWAHLFHQHAEAGQRQSAADQP
jgi:hypothetical protein